MQHETIGERLRRLRKALGLTQAQLAAKSGVGQSTIGNIESELRGYGASVVNVAKALGTSPEYLQLQGDAADYRAANITHAELGTRKVPVVSYVQAGDWAEPHSPNMVAEEPAEYLLTDLALSSQAFALEIKGDSMRPDFVAGDRVIIDPTVAPRPGDYVVAMNGGNEAVFKKYRPRSINGQGDTVFELTPLNPDYPTMLSSECAIRIIGTMVEHRRYRKPR